MPLFSFEKEKKEIFNNIISCLESIREDKDLDIKNAKLDIIISELTRMNNKKLSLEEGVDTSRILKFKISRL